MGALMDGRPLLQKTTPDEGEQFSIGQAPMGEIVKTNGVELVKGTNMINNQSCEHTGEKCLCNRAKYY